MSLFGSIQIANNALFAAQTGLQVTSNNIANANTPGYLRQRVVQNPAPTQLVGTLPLGLGVEVAAIVQQTDRFLAERLRGAVSDLAQSETQENVYLQLEAIIGELGESDLSTSLNQFFSAIHNVLNQPEDRSLRNLAVLQGDILADDFRRLSQRLSDMRRNVNEEIVAAAGDVNRLLEKIAELNVQIVMIEGGGSSESDAVGLRDQREGALAELAGIIGVRAVEQTDGSVTVFAGGDYLVSQGEFRRVAVSYEDQAGLPLATIHVEDSDSPLSATAGSLGGKYAARDTILGGFLEDLDRLAGTLAFEFNKIHSAGQGLAGHRALTSQFAATDANAALDQAGLAFTPVNGSLQVLVRDVTTGLTKTTDVAIDLNGFDTDLSLSGLAEALDAIEGIHAEITSDQRLRITSDSAAIDFGFAEDTSGVLAALGLNTFFTGSSAADLGVSGVLRADPGALATSRGGFGADAENAERLAEFARQPLAAQGGLSLTDMYDALVAGTTQASAVTQAVTEGFRVYQRTLEGQHLGISGVSIDDEIVNMITYQRVYQASARFIAAIGELLDVLVNL